LRQADLPPPFPRSSFLLIIFLTSLSLCIFSIEPLPAAPPLLSAIQGLKKVSPDCFLIAFFFSFLALSPVKNASLAPSSQPSRFPLPPSLSSSGRSPSAHYWDLRSVSHKDADGIIFLCLPASFPLVCPAFGETGTTLSPDSRLLLPPPRFISAPLQFSDRLQSCEDGSAGRLLGSVFPLV